MTTAEAKRPDDTQRVRITDSKVVRTLGGLAVGVGAVVAAFASFDYLRDAEGNRIVLVAVALGVGAGGAFALFYGMDRLVNVLPVRWRERVRPYVYIAPTFAMLGIFLVYPLVNTIVMSFKDAHSQSWVGLDNYEFVFSDDSMRRALRNTFLWIVIVPAIAVTVGLVFATLADRLKRGESLAKSFIFLPMAISFVGAAVTWRLIYSYRPRGFGTNIGLLNALRENFGQEPIAWISQRPWNNFLLMLIMVWMQTGFAMVVLSASIKAIPDEIVEAARIDGASEFQVFRRVVVPNIVPTIVVVTTYMVINALKVFDIVFVMGNPEADGTEVVAERMIRWFFLNDNDGRGAAIAVILFLAVIPVMIWNVRRFREQEAIR